MTNEMSSTMLTGAHAAHCVTDQQSTHPKKRKPRSFLWTIYLYIRGIARVAFIIANNLYCLPTYLIWITMLWPLKMINSRLYYKIEGILYHWLFNMIVVWGHSAGYGVLEYGDPVEMYLEKRALVIANHQSTGDVPILMASFNAKPMVVPNIMWVMDAIFKYTNFGIVCSYHHDFFIESGPEKRDEAVDKLKHHLATKYVERNRRWLVLFPEGGFLRKRIAKGQKYALKNNLPILHNITLPRLGALNGIRDELIAPRAAEDVSQNNNDYLSIKDSMARTDLAKPDHRLTVDSDSKLEYLIDITVAYPDGGKALDVMNILHGMRPPCDTHLYYRVYPMNEVPTSDEGLKNWIYDRFIEKEHMLATFYRTNSWPVDPHFYRHSVSHATSPRDLTARRVRHDVLRSVILHLVFLLSTYVHVQMFIGLAYLWSQLIRMWWPED